MVVIGCIVACSKWRDRVVAQVDGTKITARALKAQMDMQRGKYDAATLTEKANFEEFRRQALGKLIQEEVLLAESKRLGIRATPEELKEIDGIYKETMAVTRDGTTPFVEAIDPRVWREGQEKRAVLQKLIRQEVIDKAPVADEKIIQYYRHNPNEFNRPEQFHARQILVDNQELADSILTKLKNGESFEKLAKEYSLSPDGKRGGDLGSFDERTYPQIFLDICRQLKVGEVSGVMVTDYGFQIFELLDRRPPHRITLEEARDGIRQQMREEKGEAAIMAWSDALMAKARVTINEEVLREVGSER